MIRRLLAFALLCLALTGLTRAGEDPELAALFADRHAEGTLVMTSLKSGRVFVHDEARAARPVSPASTFKILNTLISVQEGAVSGKDAVFHWDGVVRDFPSWNQDQTLASAFRVSCVWCYQELARKVGPAPYRKTLARIGYGRLPESFDVTTFWLDGSLTVSANTQVDILKKIYQRELPFSDRAYDTLRDIMMAERTPAYALWAKTGWAARMTPQIGWYVGYVEAGEDVWFFALNMDIHGEGDLPLRQQLVLSALKAKRIIPDV